VVSAIPGYSQNSLNTFPRIIRVFCIDERIISYGGHVSEVRMTHPWLFVFPGVVNGRI